jgi:hypothetical protein
MKNRQYSYGEIREEVTTTNGKKRHKCFLNNKQVNCNNNKFLSVKKKMRSINIFSRLFGDHFFSRIQHRQKTKKRR